MKYGRIPHTFLAVISAFESKFVLRNVSLGISDIDFLGFYRSRLVLQGIGTFIGISRGKFVMEFYRLGMNTNPP